MTRSEESRPAFASGTTVEPAAQVRVPQGRAVLFWGIVGILLAIVPSVTLLLDTCRVAPAWSYIAPTLWACLVGWPVTYYWSVALHERIALLRQKLDKASALLPDEKTQYPGRVPWMPAWIGIFERAFYSVLIGLNVEGGAAFIGVWVGMKLAGGWQIWSKGTTYGRAIFFSGLLGNAMSLAFGVVAGILMRATASP